MIKVALIGVGMVGTSFIDVAKNQGLADEYGLIDISDSFVEGNTMDFEDTIPTTKKEFTIKKYRYEDLKDVNYIVITAGRPQKENETRLNMVLDNAKILKNIALQIKNSGFSGITIIASNPVDIMTTIYMRETNFPSHKIIGSGTSLDTMRLKVELAKKFNVHPHEVKAYVLGEHGDSSFCNFSDATIKNKSLNSFNLSEEEKNLIQKNVYEKAQNIIAKKRITNYGIGSTLAYLLNAIINNTNEIIPVDAYLPELGVHIGLPVQLGSKGIVKIWYPNLDVNEQKEFDNSIEVLKETLSKIL